MYRKKHTEGSQSAIIIMILFISWFVNPNNYPFSTISPLRYEKCRSWQASLYGEACNSKETYGEEGYLYWLIDTEAYLPLNNTFIISLWKIGIEVDGYGLVDLSHATGSYDITDQIFCGIQTAITNHQNSLFLRWQDLEVRYFINTDLLVDEEAVISMAYGIFQDFSVRFENYQEEQGLPRSLSAFSKEDLAANHMGFFAYINGRNKDKSAAIAEIIRLLANNKDENYTAVNVFQDPFDQKNHEWNFVDCDRQTCQMIQWPTALQIRPILESPTTWQASPLPAS